MRKHLHEEFKHLEGQPVRIFTDDRRVHRGIVVESLESCVIIIDRCSRVNHVEFCHIAAIEEPQMKLRRCRRDDDDDDDGRRRFDDDRRNDRD